MGVGTKVEFCLRPIVRADARDFAALSASRTILESSSHDFIYRGLSCGPVAPSFLVFEFIEGGLRFWWKTKCIEQGSLGAANKYVERPTGRSPAQVLSNYFHVKFTCQNPLAVSLKMISSLGPHLSSMKVEKDLCQTCRPCTAADLILR